jgi:hypothetical protein
MVGQQLTVFFDPVRVEGFYGGSDLFMNFFSPLEK